MNDYFREDILLSSKKQRKNSLLIYFAVLGVFVAVAVSLFIWYLTLPYASPKITTVKLILYPMTVLFVVFSFIYLGIKDKRIKKYYNLCKKLSVGIRETSVAEFIGYDETITAKDGVDVKALIFSEWNKYKNEYYERKVRVFYDRDFPELIEGDTYEFVTVGNFLISYGKK